MKNYFKKTEFILDLLYLYHHGNRYEGQGIMTWNPDEGFHLQAFLNGQKKPIEKVDLGRVQITPKSDICSIRMRPQGGYDWAIIPNVRLSDWNKLDTQKITEIRKKRDFSSLGLLSPFGSSKFEKQAFINLTEFFIRDTSKAEVCRRIFWQLVEVSNQHSQQAQELLLSTILEASLRSIDGRPFTAKKDKSWNVGKGLENFFNAYLPSDEWTDTRSRIMREHCYLRDRNAHPDWLFSQGGSFSEAEQAQSLDSMIFLSRFYGYIIFALAGFQGLKPIFPSSHQTWGAAATITVASNLNLENAFPDLHILGEMSDLKKLTKQLSEAKTYYEKTMIWRKFKRGMK